jgi:hypothetical protein
MSRAIKGLEEGASRASERLASQTIEGGKELQHKVG